MKSQKTLVLLVATLLLAVLAFANVSAEDNLGYIKSVEVNGVEGLNTQNIAVFAGETLPVRVTFYVWDNASDARIKVWISGARDYSVSSDRFAVDAGSTYSKLFSVRVPFEVDPQEKLTLRVSVESPNDGSVVERSISLSAQRESYLVEVLDVNLNNNAKAGEPLALGIVLKNRGREFAEDTFVKVTIPGLGIEQKAYFGDLAPVDQGGDVITKEDAVERRMLLNIPSSARAGVYTLELEAYNGDSSTTLTKKVAVSGASDDSVVVSPSSAKTFAVGETVSYSVTLVNAGNRVKVYELTTETSSEDLNADVSESLVVVPAGDSKTVRVDANAVKTGKYTFDVVIKSNGDLVEKKTFMANVEGKARSAANTTVLLTVVLAIIFVVLLVVLIVLLTRKPEKTREFGESYY